MGNSIKKAVLVVLTVFVWCSSFCFAQASLFKDFTREGQLVSEGSNTAPYGDLKVTTYRLEKVELGRPLDLMDGKPPIRFAFRLLIMTDRDLPVSGFDIWLNDRRLTASAVDTKTVGTVVYKRTLPDGATLGLSGYGENEMIYRSILPEKLEVPLEYATPLDEIETNQAVIRLLRRPFRTPVIELRVDVPEMRCYVGGIGFSIEIDGREFNTSCAGRAMLLSFSIEEFAKLRDGAEIAVKRGIGRKSGGRRVVGRLNKSAIE